MSTHRRAWQHRAGVVVALIFGALLTVPATPALAADVSVSPGSVTVNAGSDTTVTVRVTPGEGDQNAQIGITGLPSGVSCVSGCGQVNFAPGNPMPKTQLLTIRANDNAGDANGSVTVQVQPDKSDPATGTFNLTVKGKAAPPPQQPQTVKTVSGKVVDSNGEPISGALVMLRDSAGKERRTNTNGSGNFTFSGSADNPIAPGRIDLGASADGATPSAKSINAAAGQSVTGIRIGVALKASASPSATPSASESAPPSEEATEEEVTEGPATEAPAAQQPTAAEDSGGFGNWLLILLGGLFVAVGVGTIVLLYMRRKNDEGDGDGPDGPAGPGGPGGGAAAGAIPAAHGAYRGVDDQTRVVNGMGAGPAPTMVGGAAMSEAPTMLQRPVVDDVPPDPYGAPPGPAYGVGAGQAGYGYGDDAPGQGGYGYGNAPSSGAGNGYGNAPSSGGGYGNGPSSGAGYGSPDYAAGAAGAAGYGAAQGGGGYAGERFDEPTGRYTGDSTQYAPAADPYPTSTYQPEQGRGYDQSGPGQYGRGAEQADGYGAGAGYGAASGGGYDGNPAGGYDGGRQQGGYGDAPGYGDSRPGGGYGDAPTGGYDGGRQQGGYDNAPNGGYDNAPGYGDSRPASGYGDAPTGGYDGGRQQGGYGDAPTGGYGSHQGGGYDGRQPGGYDGGQAGAAYGNASGGYDGGHQPGGYDQQGGYDQRGGYGQQGGYGQEPPQQRGPGYDNQAGYPDDSAQSGRGRADGTPDRGGRRLDWLDD
ncbi:carboxypeptidase regulatory-like domain-containing protein [Micromonospora sp. NPDC051141]|uniref:carboxypeptidase regulatory-like domain-containing protein n=1 Tax=Micromonospora sp. NPDC051141 TaxID=3364284 RepID=UPI0037A21925